MGIYNIYLSIYLFTYGGIRKKIYALGHFFIYLYILSIYLFVEK